MMIAVSPKNTEEKVRVLGVEAVDRILDEGLAFTRWFAGHGHPPAISHV